MSRNKINKKTQRNITLHRINILFEQAEKKAKKKQYYLANRYIDLARKLSMKNLTPIPSFLKRRFCKHCYYYLVPDINCRVRIKNGKIVIYCYNCHKFIRLPIK
jgi:ribonuclease P protein subunit RPR2